MTVQIPQTKRDAIFNEYCRIQDKITKVAEKEHKAQLRRRRYVLDAFGKWLDKAARGEVETLLKTLSDASSVADSKRIADYLASLPPEPEAELRKTSAVKQNTVEPVRPQVAKQDEET